ncbi:MAG: amidohydrolase family protein [Promethearchaeota archaeon]
MKKEIYRIDIHHHIVPPIYLSSLARFNITKVSSSSFPNWNPEQSLELMDRQNIAIALTSISTPGIFFGDIDFTKNLARLCNNYLADLIRKHPKRFGGFAVLPIPDYEASLQELEYALDKLKLDGVGMLTNINGKYVGDPEYNDLFAELNKRNSVVFIHPNSPPDEKLPNLSFPASTLEFVFDTTRAIANLLYNDIFKKYQNIKFIFAHAGGTAPYIVWRISFGNKKLRKFFRNLYYDTALSATKSVFRSLMELVDISHILFGSDYPFVHEIVVKEMIQLIADNQDFDEESRFMIEQNNALSLFPRLRSYL